jgi:hypothetical protein
MVEDLIQLPELADVKEMLVIAKQDIQREVENDSELEPSSKLVLQVIDIIEERVAKEKNLERLSLKDKISIAAHLSFLHSLLEDFFNIDEFDEEEFDEEEFEDEDDSDDER